MQRQPTLDAVRGSVSCQPRAKLWQHSFRVIARLCRLLDSRDTIGRQPCQQHCGFDLGARDWKLISDRLQWAPSGNAEWSATVGLQLDLGSHQAQRFGYARHRTCEQ